LWDLLFELAAEGITLVVTTHYMDEAERCGRVGYLYLSKLLVVGTPNELKQLPTVTPDGMKRIELYASDTAGLLNRLRHRESVHEATIFGQSIHALVNRDDPLTDLRSEGIRIQDSEANLEDVFVTLSRAAAKNALDKN
jgi:ABC-type multidrug transport system ATPase subunit